MAEVITWPESEHKMWEFHFSRYPPLRVLLAAYFNAGIFKEDEDAEDKEDEEAAEAWMRRDSLKQYA